MTGSGTLRDIGNASIFGVTTARTGGDTFALNGQTLTIDQDIRYGLSGATTFTLGSITVSPTTGGNLIIDATKVWLIPFTGGSGTMTAGTAITLSGVTCNTIGIWSAVNTAPVLTGVATGFIKVTNASAQPPSSGTFTQAGYTFTISGAPVRGFIEVNGDESSTITANRLGTVQFKGAWYAVGTTSGSNATTYQLPTNGSVQYYPAVYVDSDAATITGATRSAGSVTYQVASHSFVVGDEVTVTGASPAGYNVVDAIITAVTNTSYTITLADPGAWVSGGSAVVPEVYTCAGSLVAAASTPTDAVRGKVFWATTAGVLRFGSDGTNAVGYVPPAGRRIRLPNIITANNTTAARATNVLPNATLATRYDFTTTGGGVVDIQKASLAWYPSFAQAYSVVMKHSGICTQLIMSEIAQPMTVCRVGVGQEAANAQFGLSISLCFAGGNFEGSVFTSASLATAGRYIFSGTDIAGFTFNKCKVFALVIRANATTGSATLTRAQNCNFNNQTIGLGQVLLTTCTNVNYYNTVYYDAITTTGTTNPMSIWLCSANTINCVFDGLTFGGLTNVHPYTAILTINAAGCANLKLRRIGTSPSAQLSLGATNSTGTVCAIATGAAAQDIKLQRIFTSLTRTNLYSGDNSSTRITVDNCMGDYADVPVNNMLNVLCRGVGATPTYAAQTAVYGTHWFDHFISATVGRIAILMNEPTVLTAAQVSLTGGAAFTAAGGLYMPVIGQTATFEMPYYTLGHTQFTNSAAIMAGGTATNYNYNFSVDLNNGVGWSTMTTANYTATTLATALNALGAINPALGVKLRLKITTTVTNTTAITSLYLITTTTAAAQANYYPLETVNIVIDAKDAATSAPIQDARVYLVAGAGGFLPEGTVILNNLTNASGVVSTSIELSGASQPVIGRVRKMTDSPRYRNSPLSGTITSAGLEITSFLVSDE
jgi:hypothetical protein